MGGLSQRLNYASTHTAMPRIGPIGAKEFLGERLSTEFPLASEPSSAERARKLTLLGASALL